MTADIIPFPVKQETEHKYTVAGQPVMPPTNGWEYLKLCKEFLTVEDYMDVLTSILDPEYYHEIEEELQNIVESFYELEVSSYGR